MRDASLEHYGVKGMKWGVRKQEKRVSTSRRKKSLSKDSSKSKHRLALEKKYLAQGMTQKEAEAAAAKRIKMEKIMLEAAGVTLAAAGAYVAYNKYADAYIDKTLKTGTKFQTITKATIKPIKDARSQRTLDDLKALGIKEYDFLDRQRFYAAYNDKDKRTYLEQLGRKFAKDKGWATVVTTQAKKDLKMASPKSAAKVFSSLYKDDSSFQAAIDSSLFRTSQDPDITDKQFKILRKAMTDLAKGKNPEKAYTAFNMALVDKNAAVLSSTEKFYKALKAAGYSAIEDINDNKVSDLRTKSSVIIFDPDAMEVTDVAQRGKLYVERLIEELKKG